MADLTLATEFVRGTTAANLIDAWASQIAEQSNNAHSITVYHPGELVGAFEVFDAISSGQVDLGWFSPVTSFFSEKFNALSIGFETEVGATSSQALHSTLVDGFLTSLGLRFWRRPTANLSY